MRIISGFLFICLLALPGASCRRALDYFRDPDAESLEETLQTCLMTGYAANLAFAAMDGQSFPQMTFSRSNPGFPCTTLMTLHPIADSTPYLVRQKANTITVAGLWADESTAIFSILLTHYEAGTASFDLLGINTVPAIRESGHIHVALAHMDIQLNPDQDALLHIDLNTGEVETELFRLDVAEPTDVYVAVLEDAYYVDVDNNFTGNDIKDDLYTCTGGGQLIKVNNDDAQITQQAMVGVLVSPDCEQNPLDGMALLQVTGTQARGFPDLGSALLQFGPACSGTVHVTLATGMYTASNGKSVPFHF